MKKTHQDDRVQDALDRNASHEELDQAIGSYMAACTQGIGVSFAEKIVKNVEGKVKAEHAAGESVTPFMSAVGDVAHQIIESTGHLAESGYSATKSLQQGQWSIMKAALDHAAESADPVADLRQSAEEIRKGSKLVFESSCNFDCKPETMHKFLKNFFEHKLHPGENGEPDMDATVDAFTHASFQLRTKPLWHGETLEASFEKTKHFDFTVPKALAGDEAQIHECVDQMLAQSINQFRHHDQSGGPKLKFASLEDRLVTAKAEKTTSETASHSIGEEGHDVSKGMSH